MRLFVYDMLVNVNGIYYVHVGEQARWARSAGNSAIENVCIIIIIMILTTKTWVAYGNSHPACVYLKWCTSGGVYVPCIYTYARWELP